MTNESGHTSRLRGPASLLLAVCLPFSLCGCQGMYVHNADRATVAAAAKRNVDSVDIGEIVKAEQENLANILAEEIKSIDARSRHVATLSTIQLAATDISVAQHYVGAMAKMKLALNTDSILTFRDANACHINKKNAGPAIKTGKELLEALGAQTIPRCAIDMPMTLQRPAGVPPEDGKAFEDAYGRYRQNCMFDVAVCYTMPEAKALESARAMAEAKKTQAQADKAAVLKAREEYTQALEANKKGAKRAAEREEDSRAKARKVLDAINKLSASSPVVANQIKGAALVELLTAAASGKGDATDPALAPALELAKSVPVLLESAETAKAARAMLPVSHLLLALNNVVIQAERDERMAALDEEEITLLERKVETRNAQTELWRRYSDSLCNLVLLKAGKGHPETSCERIELPHPLPAKGLTCGIRLTADQNAKPEVIENCVLGQTWRELFGADLNAAQRRQLYEAAAAYLHVRLIAYKTTVDEFKRIDILHRRNVVEREAALLQWKNLVSVPTDELNGYYSGGIKPYELADLIVKALGLTAIAIGVSK